MPFTERLGIQTGKFRKKWKENILPYQHLCKWVPPVVSSYGRHHGSSSSLPTWRQNRISRDQVPTEKGGGRERKCHHPIDFSIVRWSGEKRGRRSSNLREVMGMRMSLYHSPPTLNPEMARHGRPPSPSPAWESLEDEGNYYSPKGNLCWQPEGS